MGKNIEVLILDTATPWLYLNQFTFNKENDKNAINQFVKSYSSRNQIFEKIDREKDDWLAEIFHNFTKDLDRKADILFIGEGPGSFTSLRISFSFLKTLAMLRKTPIYTFSSIDFYEKNLIDFSSFSKNQEFYLLIRANKNLFYGKKILEKGKQNKGDIEILAQNFDDWIYTFSHDIKYKNKQIFIWNSSWMSRKDITGCKENELNWPKEFIIINKPEINSKSCDYFLEHPKLLSNDLSSWKTIFPKYGHEINYVPRKQVNYWK